MKPIFSKLWLACLFLQLFNSYSFAQIKTDRAIITFVEQDEYFNKKYGVKDSFDGRVILPAKYDDIHEFKSGLFQVTLNKRLGIVDTNNKVIVPCKYEYVSIPYKGRMIVGINDKYYLADLMGKSVSQTKYYDIDDLENGYYITYKIIGENHKLQGLIDKNGKVILPIKYQDITITDSKIIAARQIFEIQPKQAASPNVKVNSEDKYYELAEQRMLVFNVLGNKMYESKDGTGDFLIFENGLLVKEKWIKDCGFYNTTSEVISPTFKVLINYNECITTWFKDVWFLIRDNKNGKYGLMDFNGNIILKPIYKEISDFDLEKGYATVVYDDENRLKIDINGKRID